MSNTQYKIQTETKEAYLSGDFGKSYAMKVFNLTEEELTELVGVISRGKRKGLLRGKISWEKVTRGGWVKTGPYNWDTCTPCGFVSMNGVTCGHGIFSSTGELLKGWDMWRNGLDVNGLERANRVKKDYLDSLKK